jgi:hypothetical protein
VWICTTRPYLRLDNIDPDTREWLRRNKIQHDAVLWGSNKYRELVRIAGRERVVAVLDDLPEMAEQAASVGIAPVYLRDQPYNRHYSSGVVRWAEFANVRNDINRLIRKWKENNK